jgi:hypothetical protein
MTAPAGGLGLGSNADRAGGSILDASVVPEAAAAVAVLVEECPMENSGSSARVAGSGVGPKGVAMGPAGE